jgi:glycosyltransferase involved in cell wall biosynthesis
MTQTRTVVAMISRNEERAVGVVLDEIKRHAIDAHVLLVDSSTDRTADIAEAAGAETIRQLPPRGYGPAMMRALTEGALRGDVVVTLDCDNTYPADRIVSLARMVREDGWDLVSGSRMVTRPAAMPLSNWLANTGFALITRAVHGLAVTDVHSGMRAYRSSMLREVEFFANAAALPVELLIKPARLGYRVTEVPIDYRPRIGETTLDRFDSTRWTLERIARALKHGERVRR